MKTPFLGLVISAGVVALTGVAAHANLISNDSFENDGINSSTLICPVSDWSASLSCSTINAGETSTFDPGLDGHSGYLAIGTVGQLGFFSQTISTIVGQQYAFSFSFSGDGIASNQFEAIWDGTVVMDVVDAPYNPDWAGSGSSDVYTFIETATSTSTTVSFGGEGNGASFIGVDDVSVDPVPEPSSLPLLAAALLGLALARRRLPKNAAL